MKKDEYQSLVNDMTWSFSRLNYSCEYCWLQNYILKNRDKSDGNCFSDYGLMNHKLSEEFVRGDIFEWQLEGLFKDGFKDVDKFPPNKYVNLREDYYNQGIEFFKLGFDFLKEYDIISVEAKTNTTLNNGKPFIGFIDLILKDDDGYIVWDWKSKKNFKNIKERNKYARQLYMYSKHVKEEYGEFPSKLMFYHFRTQKITVIKFDKDMYDEAFEWAEGQVDKLMNIEEFNVTDSYFFGRYLCNYRNQDMHKKGNSIKLEDVKIDES